MKIDTTTRIRKQARALAIASALALTVLAAPALQGRALAAVPDGCEQTASCQRLKCSLDGKSFNYNGGDVAEVKGVDGRTRTYMCDGRTGKWIQLRTATDTEPTAPRPTTAAQ